MQGRQAEKPLSALLQRILTVVKGDAAQASTCSRASTWFWRISSAGSISPWLAMTAGIMSLLHSAFDASNLREACVGFMDASTMFLCGSYLHFAAYQQPETWRVLGELLALTRSIEETTEDKGRLRRDDAEALELREELRNAARFLRCLVLAESCTVAGGTVALVSTPIITGKLTFTAWPHPEPGSAYWWMVLSLQEMSSFAAGASLSAVMAFVLAAVCCSAALARAVAIQLKFCRSEAAVARVVVAHQAVLQASAAASRHVNVALLPMVYGYLAVSLVGTYNLAAGRIDPYAAVVVPACLLFLFFFAVIGDLLESSLERVGAQAALLDVAWFQSAQVPGGVSSRTARVLLLPVMVRCRRPGSASVRVAWVGALRLHSFMRVMKRWYSALQMMRSVQ